MVTLRTKLLLPSAVTQSVFIFKDCMSFLFSRNSRMSMPDIIHVSSRPCQLGLELEIIFLVFFSGNEINRVCQRLGSLFLTFGWKGNI